MHHHFNIRRDLRSLGQFSITSTIVLFVLVVVLPIVSSHSLAQSTEQRYPPAIEDNSFLLEEAYNQEGGIVQHISTLSFWNSPTSEAEYVFTQEWPVGSQTHQFSYTIPASVVSSSHACGLGNVILNYRYQMFDGSSWAAFAPRLSLIIPSSVDGYQQHLGSVGWQVNLPFSRRLSAAWVVHVNVGTTVLPDVHRNTAAAGERRATLDQMTAGVGLIWLAREQSNLMLELLASSGSSLNDDGEVIRGSSVTVNPGYRHAFDIGSLQIVPGFSVPVTFVDGDVSTSLLLYLSFEHAF